MKHPKGWSRINHYCNIGGQCGQSCPCCRAYVYNKGLDYDAWFGACQICIKKPKKK
jgi:hypothetical protein